MHRMGWWVLVLVLGRATTAGAICGDMVLEPPGETCDDGNLDDGDGCSAACQDENRAPVCDAASASPAALWPPNHKFVPIAIDGVTDPDGDPVAITVTTIAQDEPLAGAGDGDTCPDASGVGTDTASVRAERSGQGDGRVYHIAFAADDGHGGSCMGAIVVCVRHDNGRGSTCGDQGALIDATGTAPADACSATCHPEACAPDDDALAPTACGTETVPTRVGRRVGRARALLARSAEQPVERRARRLGRRAARHLHAAAAVVTRATGAGRLSEDCGAALHAVLNDAGDCAACGDD